MQAAACLYLGTLRGVFIQGRVGIGKTLALALAPKVAKCERAVIIVPGGILKEVKAHIESLRRHWELPVGVMVVSFTTLSRYPAAGKTLGDLWGGQGPDGIFPDEVHNLSNVGGAGRSKQGSAVARLINDWMVAHPETVFGSATGSCDVHGIRDYSHLLDWALRDGSPLPRDPAELEVWARVIDDGCEADAAWVGAQLDPEYRPATVTAVRRVYRERLRSTPGVIIADDQFTAVPLTVSEHVVTDPKLDEHFERLRELWQRPDGLDVLDERVSEDDLAADREPDRVDGSIWAVARRMARGLCYVLDPPPPAEWKQARREYFSYARALLEEGIFYTELQVRRHAEECGAPAWLAWKAIRPQYDPKQHQKTMWLSTAALEWAEDWGQREPGIIWTDDTAFAVELAARTGWVFYAGKGFARTGEYIEDAPRGVTAIASRRANGTGRNLQYQWSRMLFTCVPANAAITEQNLGREHREGIETWASSVHADIMIGCSEDRGAIQKVFAGAYRTRESIYDCKVLHANWTRVENVPDSPAFGSK